MRFDKELCNNDIFRIPSEYTTQGSSQPSHNDALACSSKHRDVTCKENPAVVIGWPAHQTLGCGNMCQTDSVIKGFGSILFQRAQASLVSP